MKNNRWLSVAFWSAVFFLGSCATPSTPTGGPPDKQGPEIVETEPITGTTNFSQRSITLHFSEFVNRGSLNEAIVIEPDIGISYDLDWGRRSVAIEFDEDIPDLTTLIVTVGTEFKDMNGNGMASPVKIAVSTGPEIDKGKLFGRVISTATGRGEEGQRILLYREPFDLTQKANYIASTDTGGTFQFSYLREGTYKAFWVDDRNRNKIWEPEQERAQPFSQEFIDLKKAGTDTLGKVYVTAVDTTQPVLQGIGLFSSRRLRMRFSENIELTDSADITVTDTMSNTFSNAFPLYIQPDEPFILFGHSEKPLSPTSNYTLDINGVVDAGGNELAEITQTFTGSAQEDTTQQRIIKRNTTSGYYPSDAFEITYAEPIDEPTIRDSLKVIAGDELEEDWPNVKIRRNVLRILPQGTWEDGLQYEVRVWDPRMNDYRKFQPQIWHASQMGALNVSLEDSTTENIRLQIENEESGIFRDTTFSGSIEIANLPPVQYKVVAYHDQNNNGSWDFGQVIPYIKPEPYFIQINVPVREGMTGDLMVQFQN